jgi:hypothetical protein
VGWRWENEKPWSANVATAIPAEATALVVGDALDPAPFTAWVETVDAIRQTRRRSWSYHGSVSEYVEFCRPLLVNSPAAYLIDPFLDPFSDFSENLIRSLFACAKGSCCYSLEIITRRAACGRQGKPDDAPILPYMEIDEWFRSTYRDWVPKDRALKLHLVDDGPFGSEALRLHDRYFLTKHGSVKFGQGFVVGNQKVPTQNAFVTDKDHHTQLKQTFIEGVARHRERQPRIPGIPYPIDVQTTVVSRETTQSRLA